MFRVSDLGFWVQGSGFRVSGFGCRGTDARLRDATSDEASCGESRIFCTSSSNACGQHLVSIWSACGHHLVSIR